MENCEHFVKIQGFLYENRFRAKSVPNIYVVKEMFGGIFAMKPSTTSRKLIVITKSLYSADIHTFLQGWIRYMQKFVWHLQPIKASTLAQKSQNDYFLNAQLFAKFPSKKFFRLSFSQFLIFSFTELARNEIHFH